MKNHTLSRREFMRSSAGAGMAMAVPPYLLDSESSSESPQPVPPSDRIRFGMIGIGMEGSGVLATSISLRGVECVAACDLYDGRHTLANQIISGETGKTVPATRRYQDLLDNKDIDCVVVAVPDHWHKQIIVDACNAGKDVYCEKPMTHKVEEGFEIIDAAKKNNRIVQIGSQRRSSINFERAKQLIDQGAIGDVWYVEAILGRNSPCGAWVYPPPPDLSPQNLDWKTWLGDAPYHSFDPIRFARWRSYKDYGEGLPGDLFVHTLTGVYFVMGLDSAPQRALTHGGLYYWKGARILPETERDFPDLMLTLYEYPNLQVAVLMTQMTHQREVTRFLGTRGIIEVYGDGDQLTIMPQDGNDHDPCYYTSSYPAKMRAAYDKEWHEKHDPRLGTEIKPVEGQQTFYYPANYTEFENHLWNFFESVRTRRPSVEDAVVGNNTSIGCHMANYSYFHKTAAVWDAASRRIVA